MSVLDGKPIVQTLTTVHLGEPGTHEIATTAGAVTATLPQRNQSPASTGKDVAPSLQPPRRVHVLTTSRTTTIACSGSDAFHTGGGTTTTSITLQPGDTVLIIDDGGYWLPIWETRNDSLRLGVVKTVDPRYAFSYATLAANRTYYMRADNGGYISKIGFEIDISSGNVCVSVFRNTGSGKDCLPGARAATSGSVACPATGALAEVALDSAVHVAPGDWLAISADNTTARFARFTMTNAYLNATGFAARQDSAHPAPSTASATAGVTIIPVLVGLP